MKGILVLILAAAVGYLSYQYVYPVLATYVKFEKKKAVAVAVAPKPEPVKKPVVVVAPPPMPKEEPKPVMEAPKPAPKPMVVEAPKPVVDPNAFVPPPLPSMADLTRGWTVIPPNAFKPARQITLKRDLELSLRMGANTAKTSVKAGGKMFAVGHDSNGLIVAPSPESPMRGVVALDDTDLKESLTAWHENWKVGELARLKKAHEYRLAAVEAAKNAPVAAKAAAGNDKPTRDKDGTYPLLVASMKSGQVTEIKLDTIKEWGEPVLEGDLWKVNVKYETITMFGKFDTEAQAQIKNGVVQQWIYTGSGEVVP